MHARTTIRQAFVEVLKGKTIALDHVYDSRVYPLEKAVLPAIIVYSTNEEIAVETIGLFRAQERRAHITVECYVKASLEVNITIDNLTAEVEKLVFSDKRLKSISKDLRLEATDINLNNDSDQPVAVANLAFTVTYRTKESKPREIV